jgi:hypothetical protein
LLLPFLNLRPLRISWFMVGTDISSVKKGHLNDYDGPSSFKTKRCCA